MNFGNDEIDNSDLSLNLGNFGDGKSNISHSAVILGIIIFIVFCVGIVWGWKWAALLFS